MCGIVGLASPDPGDLRPLPVMTGALRHRGPDGEGYLYAESRTGRHWAFRGPETPPGIELPALPDGPPPGADVALGHRRLAIIDLGHGGHGPMSSADGRLWISYNGEVFNYRELREELKARGHAFRSASDTEVLLAAYAEWGEDALSRLNGMWAFVLYDARRGVLFCARDRFGVKPLHYSFDGRLFACASEIKALLAHPGVPRQPHLPSVSSFLTAGSLDEADQTFFRGIRRVPAGHHLTLDLKARALRVARWYTLPEEDQPRPAEPEELRALLEDAVRLRLRSDVPVGTCLSGGLDSSSIVALTARLRGEADGRRSFSVAYPDPGLDEAAHQDEVVRATGVTSARTTPTAAELLRDLPALVRAQDEPFASAAPYSQWRVMALARDAGVKVLLDGQGADEVLAGYHYHFGPYLREVAAREGLRAAVRQARLAHAVTGRPVGFFLGMLAYHGLPAPATVRRWAVGRAATHGRVPGRLMDPGLLPGNGLRHLPRPTLLAERRANILSTSLPALLRYEDRNSMAFGVEARTPFLDYRLVERALALPAAALIHDGWTKAILREASRGLIPETVRLRRDKLGFATPEQRWLREAAPQVRQWLGPHSRAADLLRPRRLRRWLKGSDAALARRPGLWRLVSLELWLRDLEQPR